MALLFRGPLRRLATAATSKIHLATAATSKIQANIVYPVRPPDNRQSGREIDQQLFTKMGHIPPEKYDGGPLDALHDEEETHMMRVVDGRTLAEPPSLAREGFELWDWPTAVDFSDDQQILDVYYREMEERVQVATGAEFVAGFHYLRRDAARDNRDSRLGPGGAQSNAGAAVFRAVRHIDHERPCPSPLAHTCRLCCGAALGLY